VARKTLQASRAVKRKANKKRPARTLGTQTAGINRSEVRRRKAAGVRQHCAWPQDRKGSHKTIDCFRWARKQRGTALVTKHYQQLKAEIQGIGSRAVQSTYT